MKLGPDYVYQCPDCGEKVLQMGVQSVNSLGCFLYSDQRIEGPMFYSPAPICRCKNCNHIYWLDHRNKTGSYLVLFSFQRTDGNTMTIPGNLLLSKIEQVFPVAIVQENPERVLVHDSRGLQASISKEILSINNLAAVNGRLTLSKAMYKHYFSEGMKRRNALIRKAFFENLHTILKNKEFILSNPEFFLLRVDGLGASAAYLGNHMPCLGGLIEDWNSSNLLKVKDIYGNDAFITRISGSPLSGSNNYTAWTPATGKFICNRFEKNWMLRFQQIRQIDRRYPYVLSENHAIVEKLLSLLKCPPVKLPCF